MSSILDQIQEANEPIDLTDYDESDGEYDSSYESDYSSVSGDYLTAQQQWEESVNQVKELFNMALFPMIGKVIGRRMAHMVWAKVADWWFI
ncbi:mitochondrial import protein 2 [[Candida] railenensis]|uniref:Mitochondrial import protein 2 n=1 Tax=[Candida] railenensis TaxID=45579 RepID=A0A9P0QQ53_9ASCO|nr:mitochondrial import protein 2 [[Candida] railenensis]